jgi:bifunctional DNA-binding transcriptional regulator/antitoxin component of YhaV-PrlF toxin-antitoxin module
MDGETTILTPASTKTESLRTTVPAWIVKQLGLKKGDKLNWIIEARKDKLIVIVSPIPVGDNSGKDII